MMVMVMVMVMAKREDQVLQLRKEERKKQKRAQDKSKMIGPFCFATQDTIEGVSEFRIDSRTMKRRKSWLKQL
jgi:hypothetical protein